MQNGKTKGDACQMMPSNTLLVHKSQLQTWQSLCTTLKPTY